MLFLISVLVEHVWNPSLAAPPSSDYKLIWQDEFDGSQLDSAKWSYRKPGRLGPRRLFSVNDPKLGKLDGKGHLLMISDSIGTDLHTVQIETKGKFETTYGYFEARMKFQKLQGHWISFFLFNQTLHTPGNPRANGTEIDVIEYSVKDADLHNVNVHWDGYYKEHKHAGHQTHVPGLSEGWHDIGCEWTSDAYIFYCDGKKMWEHNEPVSQTNQYIILSLAVSKSVGKFPPNSLPDTLLVDHVRVYKSTP